MADPFYYTRAGLRPGRIRLTCNDPPADLYMWLGEETVHYTGGFGGWNVTGRPEQVGMTTWSGVEPLQLQLPVLIGGHSLRYSAQDVIANLINVARGDADSPPGIVTIWGLPLLARRWVIENLDFGDPILRASDGHPVRQPITITLRQFVPPSLLRIKRGARGAPNAKTHTVTVKAGDTPAKIARRVHCHWTDLRKLNKSIVHKANQKLKKGTRLRVPVAASHKKPRHKHK